MKNPLYPIAEKVYKKLKPFIGKRQNPKVYKAISQLHPLEDSEKLYERLQIKKTASVSAILMIGIVSAFCLHLCSRMEGKIAEGAQIIRNEWGVGDYKIILQAKTEEWSREIPFLVEERALTKEEKSELLNRLRETLPELIKKENQDLSHVTGDLNLISSVEGYPYHLTWSSENSKRISRDGKVNRREIAKEREAVNLTVKVSDEDESVYFTYEVFLLQEVPDEEESFFRSLEQTLRSVSSDARSQIQFSLPGDFNGKNIEWEEIKPDNSVFLLVLTVLGCVLACRGMESDLESSCKKRKKQLLVEYSGFVSKLRLYLSAGLTVKNAFVRMAADYDRQQRQGKKNYLSDEMKMACYQLENGIPEEQVYQEFGRRCGEMRYRRLSFLLAVHLKQGNAQLLLLLSEEAESAEEDKRSLAKKAGEEAGTKLLFPMMLMLVVVMFLVLLPAYMDFGSI